MVVYTEVQLNKIKTCKIYEDGHTHHIYYFLSTHLVTHRYEIEVIIWGALSFYRIILTRNRNAKYACYLLIRTCMLITTHS